MEREQIIKLAKQAGFGPAVGLGIADDQFERFAALIGSATIERCAALADDFLLPDEHNRNTWKILLTHKPTREGIATAIRSLK